MANFPIAHPERRDKGLATTDATVTAIDSINVPTERVYAVKSFIVASRNTTSSGGTAGDATHYKISGVFRDSAGTVEQIGDTVKIASETDLGWDVGFSVSSPNVEIQVTGEASVDIDWRCYTHVYKVK
jgi:hypothetical protein